VIDAKQRKSAKSAQSTSAFFSRLNPDSFDEKQNQYQMSSLRHSVDVEDIEDCQEKQKKQVGLLEAQDEAESNNALIPDLQEEKLLKLSDDRSQP
jgi:aspartate/glutamate racemase